MDPSNKLAKTQHKKWKLTARPWHLEPPNLTSLCVPSKTYRAYLICLGFKCQIAQVAYLVLMLYSTDHACLYWTSTTGDLKILEIKFGSCNWPSHVMGIIKSMVINCKVIFSNRITCCGAWSTLYCLKMSWRKLFNHLDFLLPSVTAYFPWSSFLVVNRTPHTAPIVSLSSVRWVAKVVFDVLLSAISNCCSCNIFMLGILVFLMDWSIMLFSILLSVCCHVGGGEGECIPVRKLIV